MAIFLKKQNRIFRDTPYSLEIVRFNIDQVRNDWNSLSFEEGTPVEWQQKGNYYIIKEPIENSVYIARSYWKDGWIEHMWLAVDRYAEIELGNQDVVEIH